MSETSLQTPSPSASLPLRHWAGDPDRPALALHCMMGTASYWGPIARHLDGAVDLRAPDFPAHGRAPDWTAEGLDYHTSVTRQVATLIDRPLDLIGHSFGATIALRIAVGAPEAVRSLTLIEPVLFAAAPDDEQLALFARMDAAARAGQPQEALADFLGVWGLPSENGVAALSDPAQDARRLRQLSIAMAVNDTLVHDSAKILRDGGLEAIDAPVLIVMGGQSPKAIGKIADALAERMQDVGRAVVPDAGHMLPITHPAEVAGLIAVNLERA